MGSGIHFMLLSCYIGNANKIAVKAQLPLSDIYNLEE